MFKFIDKIALVFALSYLLLAFGIWYSVQRVNAQPQHLAGTEQKPYSVYRLQRSGQDRCIYIFGNLFGITAVVDYADGEGRNEFCAPLKQE